MNRKPVPSNGKLKMDDVILRPVEDKDAEMLRRWRGRDDVRIWFGDTGKIDAEAQAMWMTRYLGKDDDAMFIISLEMDSGKEIQVGAVALYDIDLATGTAEYGRIMVGEDEARGKAVAERASGILCNWAIRDLGLRQIVLWVMQDNHRAIGIYERMGFVRATPQDARDGYFCMALEKSDTS